jgi:hypothetical protein
MIFIQALLKVVGEKKHSTKSKSCGSSNTINRLKNGYEGLFSYLKDIWCYFPLHIMSVMEIYHKSEEYHAGISPEYKVEKNSMEYAFE